MYEIMLKNPTPADEKEVMDYIKKFVEADEHCPGCSFLEEYGNYREWLKHLEAFSKAETTPEGFVPCTVYIALRKSDGKMVGIIDVRHYLNDYLEKFGGHIGYSVAKEERRKGYAHTMLTLALEECKKLGIDKALITCDRENIASAKTILSCDGVLENEVENEGKITKRFWITLK